MNHDSVSGTQPTPSGHGPGAAACARLARNHRLLIDGEWREARSGHRLEVFDPATGSRIATVADAGDADAHVQEVDQPRVLQTRRDLRRVVGAERAVARRARLLVTDQAHTDHDGRAHSETDGQPFGRPPVDPSSGAVAPGLSPGRPWRPRPRSPR